MSYDKSFPFVTVSKPALMSTQLLTQWVLRYTSDKRYSGRGVKLTTHFHLVPRSRMRGDIPPVPQYVFLAWCLVQHRDNFTFLPFAFWIRMCYVSLRSTYIRCSKTIHYGFTELLYMVLIILFCTPCIFYESISYFT
jgi:hypothetical protein